MGVYDYIERAYGRTYKLGQRVAFVEEGCARKEGVVRRPISGADHYVAVEFDGAKHKVPCHPTSLEKIEAPAPDPRIDHFEAQASYRCLPIPPHCREHKAVPVKERGREAAEALLALLSARDGRGKWKLQRQPYPRGYWRDVQANNSPAPEAQHGSSSEAHHEE